jgi:hypothetical protein
VLKENVYRIWGMFVMTKKPLRTSNFYRKALNRKGSTLLSALIMGVIVVIMIFSSAIYIRSRAQAVVASANKMDNRIALDGMLAYTINGIKQSWCFSDTWMKQPTCILTDARNTARLLISDESLAYISASTTIRPNPISATRLMQISQTVNLSSVNKSHPLFNIARPLDGKYDDVTFTIKRDDSAIATTKGREVRLKILVYLKAASGVTSDDLELDSQVIVYPRELSYFGLILPGNLYLGNTTTAQADVGLTSYASAVDKGLRFESPVFVNKNLYLPASSSTAMGNVVFLDKVVIGGTGIYQGNGVYRPATAGGTNSMYNHEIKSFSGLLGGYELDQEPDDGLDFLFKTQSSSFTVEDTDYQRCLKRISASYDLSVTKNSLLFMRFDGAIGLDSFNLSANIGNIDNLNEQEITSAEAYNISVSPEIKAAAPNFKAGTVDTLEGGAIFKVKVIYAGLKPPIAALPRGVYESEFYLSRTATITLAPMGTARAAAIAVSTTPFRYGANDQFNQSNINVTFKNVNDLDLTAYTENGIVVQPSIKFAVEAFDYAYNFGQNLRQPGNINVTETAIGIYKSNGFTFFRSGNTMQIAQTSTTWSTNELLNDDKSGALKLWEPLPELRDWAALDAACIAAPDTTTGSATYASFPSANWGTSFATQAEHAWRFSTEFPDGYEPGTVNFDGGENRFDPAASPPVYPKFGIKSVINNCVIKSTANFVAGFYTCENLTIEQRQDPLRIIGTFITGKLNIHNSAYAAGIRWSSIYHPQALYELRAAKVLGRYKDGNFVPDCNSAALPPLWSPNIGIKSALAHYLCNPVSLRAADPFKWTMVDPDCGVDESVDKNKVSCKSQPRRFLVKEVSRTKGM